jgi:hypothetical protein
LHRAVRERRLLILSFQYRKGATLMTLEPEVSDGSNRPETGGSVTAKDVYVV